MQDCTKENPAHVGPTYCSTAFDPSQSSEVARGCLGLHDMPELNLPEPPLGGAVCVDRDADADAQEKVPSQLVVSFTFQYHIFISR